MLLPRRPNHLRNGVTVPVGASRPGGSVKPAPPRFRCRSATAPHAIPASGFPYDRGRPSAADRPARCLRLHGRIPVHRHGVRVVHRPVRRRPPPQPLRTGTGRRMHRTSEKIRGYQAQVPSPERPEVTALPMGSDYCRPDPGLAHRPGSALLRSRRRYDGQRCRRAGAFDPVPCPVVSRARELGHHARGPMSCRDVRSPSWLHT